MQKPNHDMPAELLILIPLGFVLWLICLPFKDISKSPMNATQIKAAVEQGKQVFWKQRNYEVVKDQAGQWHIKCHNNNNCIGLTWTDGTTLNGKPEDFFIG